MLRLRAEPLSSDWFEFLTSLFRDLEPLGHVVRSRGAGSLELDTNVPLDRSAKVSATRWDKAHHVRQQALLRAHRDEIQAFERDFEPIFVNMARFQPSAVEPTLQIVDWGNENHVRIIEYLKLSQCVAPGKLVGRRMGLLLWDIGQDDVRLIGAATLASPRYSQRIRDHRLGWKPDFPRTSPRFDAKARVIRVSGLARMMQLSMVCVLPPYHFLSGAWLAAMAPFTDVGLEAFHISLRTHDPNADLTAIVTTSGKSIYAQPFNGHRVSQIAPGISAADGARGNLYQRVVPGPNIPPLRASFEDLVSPAVKARACVLFELERPEHFARLTSPERSALAYALRRLGLQRSLFAGNDMGVHIGALGVNTFRHLRDGTSRPTNARPLLNWKQVVGVWARKFLPALASIGESAAASTMSEHKGARRRRLEAARAFPQEQIRLSWLFDAPDPSARLRIGDLVPATSSLDELELTVEQEAAESEA